MTIDRAGYPFIGGTAALAIAAALTVGSVGAVPLLVLAAFFLFFFRDPDRDSPHDPKLVLSPADGRVLVSGSADPSAAPPGDWKQISIFLSPMDVHVNRVPVSGRVRKVDFNIG
jgi:phosphatidylserine decarboxylase